MPIIQLTKEDIPAIIRCLGDGNARKVKSKDLQIIQSYFEKRYLGYGLYVEGGGGSINLQTGKYTPPESILAGYCFIKEPRKRPETMTVVRSDFRNRGIAQQLRDFAISDQPKKWKGHIIYSAVKIDNPASLSSVLKSGFTVFDVTKDGFIQLIKVLRYPREKKHSAKARS